MLARDCQQALRVTYGSKVTRLDDATEALAWLRGLDPDDAAIIRTRLSGVPWKSICWRFAISRPTADRRYRYGLALIAWHLNGHRAGDVKPSLRSLLGMSRAA